MSATSDAIALDQAELPFLDNECDAYFQDPFAAIEQIRGTDPRGGRIVRTSRGVELMAYDAGRAMLINKGLRNNDLAHYKNLGAGPYLLEYLKNGHLTAMQDGEHLTRRRTVTPLLSPGIVTDEQRAMYAAVANLLVDGFAGAGHCELVADFTHRYPIHILCRSIGIPTQDIPRFEDVTLDVALINSFPLEPHVPRIEHALGALVEYVTHLVETRAVDPQGDLIDLLVQYVRDGTMTNEGIVWTLTGFMQAAHFTTRNQTASIVRALLENDLWDAMAADPELIPRAIEEGMRYYPVILGVPRHVGEDEVVLEGIAVPPGTGVRWNPMGATRDPDRFEEPYRFDITRETKGRIPFGFGIHKCLGHSMARTDMEVAIAVLTQRLRNARITDPLRMAATGAMWGPAALPLAFDAEAVTA